MSGTKIETILEQIDKLPDNHRISEMQHYVSGKYKVFPFGLFTDDLKALANEHAAAMSEVKRLRTALENALPLLMCKFHLLYAHKVTENGFVIDWSGRDKSCQLCEWAYEAFEAVNPQGGERDDD